MKSINKLRPFTKFCCSIGELPTSYMESLTYEEQLIWFCSYLQDTVIPAVNNNGEAVEELQNLYIQLQNYVDNYFENLDVQEEINNKLDELASDGTLTTLISSYIDPYITSQNNRITQIENTIGSISNGTPKGVYARIEDLRNANPDTGVYIVSANGHIYSWTKNGTNPVDLGQYQTTGLAELSVYAKHINNTLLRLLDNKYKICGTPNYVIGSLGYNADTHTVSYGSRNDRIRTHYYMKSGAHLIFNNPNGDYKISYYVCAPDTFQAVSKFQFTDYDGSRNEFYIESDFDNISLRVSLAYDDDRQITDDNMQELIDALQIYQIQPALISTDIEKNSIAVDNAYDIKTSSIPYAKFDYGIGGNTMSFTNKNNKSVIAKIEKNETYHIKVAGSHNRFLVELLNYTPEELEKITKESNPSAVERAITGYYGKQLYDGLASGNIDEYTFTNTMGYKYLMLYYNRDDQGLSNCDIEISKDDIEVIEPNKIDYNGFSTSDINYKTINHLQREVFFTEQEYAMSCEMQGCCTDGTYLYYGMHDVADNLTGVLGKIDLATGILVSEVKNHSYGHVNGMCYYNGKLYIASASDSTNTQSRIYVVNADTLEYESEFDLANKLENPWKNISYSDYNGVGAIAYSDELNKFVVLIRRNSTGRRFRGLAILDNNFNLEKIFKINPDNVPTTNPTTLSGLDCDDSFIYVTMFKTIDGAQKDVIQLYDYNGNFIKELIINTGNADTIEGITKIGNVLYTSNANDKICRYYIKSYNNIPIGSVIKNYQLN